VLDGIIELTAAELPRFGLREPRLALAGLNPHAGEDGLLGGEEERCCSRRSVRRGPGACASRGRSRPTRCSSARHAASSTP
jgi:hypothetical protein